MSGIGLQAFRQVAQGSDNGEVRFAKGSTTELVNKGTRTQRFVTWVKELFSSNSDATRAGRQDAANKAFRDAMINEYGVLAAQAAMTGAGMTPSKNLTGAQITAALSIADANRARDGGDAAKRERLVDDYMGRVGVMIPRTPGAEAELRQRLADQVMSFPYPPEQAEVDRIGGRLLSELEHICSGPDGAGALRASIEARAALVDAHKDILRGVAEGRDVTAMAALLARAGDRLEGVAGSGAPRFQAERLNDIAARKAARELHAEDPGLVARAHANALEPGSPLQRVRLASQEIGPDWQEDRPGSSPQERGARAMSRAAIGIVSAMGHVIPARSGHLGDDLSKFSMPLTSVDFSDARAAAHACLAPRAGSGATPAPMPVPTPAVGLGLAPAPTLASTPAPAPVLDAGSTPLASAPPPAPSRSADEA